MKEKKFLRTLLLRLAIVVGVYLVIQVVTAFVESDEYSELLFNGVQQEQMGVQTPDDVQISFDKEGILSVKDLYVKDGLLYITLVPVKTGKTLMTISDLTGKGEVTQFSENYTVSPDGTITNCYTGNFTHYRLYHIYIILLSLALAVLFWTSFVISYRELRYSYHSVFCSGFAIWISLITMILILAYAEGSTMDVAYGILKESAMLCILCTLPFMLLFAAAMSISNISLILHEGFRTRNALGIIISLLMIVGSVMAVYLLYLPLPVSDFGQKLYAVFVSIYHTGFAYMECFLLGAIICGTLAARHRPKYDRDYIVILGCKVKPDGTLYPLIRGRVDRAIEFYRKQLQKTGKKAVFIPSGGQGSDEQVSEAEAMKRYLLEQGIEETQILVEDQSRNTLQNMRFSKKLIEERTQDAKAAFSTTNFHVFRSGIISRQCEFEADGMGSKTKWYFWPNAYMREVVGMLAFKWKSVIILLIPVIALAVTIRLRFS